MFLVFGNISGFPTCLHTELSVLYWTLVPGILLLLALYVKTDFFFHLVTQSGLLQLEDSWDLGCKWRVCVSGGGEWLRFHLCLNTFICGRAGSGGFCLVISLYTARPDVPGDPAGSPAVLCCSRNEN